MERILDYLPYILLTILLGFIIVLSIMDFKEFAEIKEYCFNNSNSYVKYKGCCDIPREEILFIIRKDKKDVYN